jgi:hypothetical protein
MRIMRRPRVATSMSALVVLLTLAGCGSAAPHRASAIGAGAAYAPRTYDAMGAAASGSAGSTAATTTSTWTYSVTVSRLTATTRQRAVVTVTYHCSPSGPTCRWSAEASQTDAATCPDSFDPADSIWTGPSEPTPRTEQATVTFQPSHATTTPRVCVYIE